MRSRSAWGGRRTWGGPRSYRVSCSERWEGKKSDGGEENGQDHEVTGREIRRVGFGKSKKKTWGKMEKIYLSDI